LNCIVTHRKIIQHTIAFFVIVYLSNSVQTPTKLVYQMMFLFPVGQGLSGKCSHGTPDDDSRVLTATGGIYKGRSTQNNAPGSSLHGAASAAAISATEYFLIGEGVHFPEYMYF
jgi:hypothetical protein